VRVEPPVREEERNVEDAVSGQLHGKTFRNRVPRGWYRVECYEKVNWMGDPLLLRMWNPRTDRATDGLGCVNPTVLPTQPSHGHAIRGRLNSSRAFDDACWQWL